MDGKTWDEWDRGTRLRFLAAQPGGTRKSRLLAAACCRRVWRWLSDERSRQAVVAAERLADGQPSPPDLRLAAALAEAALRDAVVAVNAAGSAADRQTRSAAEATLYAVRAALYCLSHDAETAAEAAVHAAACTVPTAAPGSLGWAAQYQMACKAEREAQNALLGEIFGGPFRTVAVAPGWLTPDVRMLARVLYEERRFDDLSVLADALEEAGCGDPRLLEHLRQPRSHVLGCWALDAVREAA